MISGTIRKLLPRDRTEALLVFLILLAGGAFYHPGQWNQNARLAATAAFVEPGTPYTGTFRIDGLMHTERLRTRDWARAEGRLYSNKAPGVTFLGIVPYFLLYHGERLAGLDPTRVSLANTNAFVVNLFISLLWNIVAALALLRLLPRFGLHSRRSATLVAATYAFATLVLPYGSSLWGHATAAAFLTLGTLALFAGSIRGSTLAGWWFGFALLTEYFAALSLGLAGVFVFLTSRTDRLRHVSRFVVGGALPIGALLIYQKVCFGSFLTTASGASDPGMLDPNKFAGQFSVPEWPIFLHIYFSGGRGILVHMPILVLSVVGMVWLYRTGRRAFAAFAIANVVGYTLAVSAMTTTWHGGVTTSTRYLIVALPFFCLLMPDLDAVPIRGAFVMLFAIAAANMFVVTATSSMLAGPSPVYGDAYSLFWRGDIAFNPLLTAVGVRGLGPALLVAVLFAIGLTLVFRRALAATDALERPPVVTRLSKIVALASMACALAWILWQTPSSSLAVLTVAAAVGGVAAGEALPLAGAIVPLLLTCWVPAPYNIPWMAALAALVIRDDAQLRWSYPPRWQPALVLWALTVALGWPLIALRELDFQSLALLSRYGVTNSAAGLTPAAAITAIAKAAAVHLLSLLWLDWLFRRFASYPSSTFRRWIVWPLVASTVGAGAFTVTRGQADRFVSFDATAQGPLIGIIAATFTFWFVRRMTRAETASGSVRPLTWVAVGVLLAVLIGGAALAARGGLRVPNRAARNGWPYTYGMHAAPPAEADSAFVTERHGVTVVSVDGPSLIVTVRAEHPDIRERPVMARVDVDGQTVIRTRLHTHDPLVRTIDVGGPRRVVVETHVDRTWRTTPEDRDSRDVGLSVSLKFRHR